MSNKQDTMGVSKATLYTYQIPFKVSMTFKQYQLRYREGVILQLTDSNRINHYIEFSPLPGFSQETLYDVKKQLIPLLSESLDNLSADKHHAPCIQLALDYLPIYLRGEATVGFITPQKKSLTSIDNIPLLQGSSKQILALYQSLKQPTLVKLKVGRSLVSEDIVTFQSLCNLNPNIKIRCDANQAWNKQQAELFFSHININYLDYIEEPTNNHQRNLELAEQFNAPLGLDETLQQVDFTYQHSRFIRAFIIKPTIIGSKQKIDQLVSIAIEKDIIVSFSSSFESIIGIQQLIKLANYYATKKRQPTISLGIDTLKYFNSTQLIDVKKIAGDCANLEVLWTSDR
jgi:O-succinylbenzoate synthase